MNGSITIKTVWKNADMLAEAAAHLFVVECKKAIQQKGTFTVALSGGSTPKGLYSLLATPKFSNNIDWAKVKVFFSDERFVPEDSGDSNYKMAKDILLDKVPLPKENIFAVPTEKIKPEKASIAYEKTIKRQLRSIYSFDLILLGVGEDGHTASLFPDSPLLLERRRFVREIFVPEKQMFRITFTFPLINAAKSIFILAAGEEKASIMKEVLSAKNRSLPITKVKPAQNLFWLLDEAAMSQL